MDAIAIATRLDKLSPPVIRFLFEQDPFRFLVCVVLSAQTTDQTVNAVAPGLFSRYPTRHDLACAKQEDVERLIHATGFHHTKAKHIIALAKELEGKEIPGTLEELVKLPGVGRKTANCYLGDVLARPAIIVDTHFSRVIRRLGLADSANPVVVEKALKRLLPEQMQYRFSMTANLLGRTTCHAKKPKCEACPLSDLCPSKGGQTPGLTRLPSLPSL